MKKFIILALTMLLAVPVFAQQNKTRKIFYMPTASTTFGEEVKIGDMFYNAADSTFYVSKVAVGRNSTPAYILASSARYAYVKEVVGGALSGTTLTASGAATLASTLDVTGATTVTGRVQSGAAGYDGQLKIYSEQGATDYAVTLNPNSTMTSNANFYLPADEPGATYPVTITTGGVMGYADQNILTTSNVTFASINGIYTSVADFDSSEVLHLYASPDTVVAAPGSGYAWEVIGATFIYDKGSNPYTRGGGIYLVYDGGSDITDTISCASTLRGSSDKIYRFPMLNTAGGNLITANKGIYIGVKLREYVGGSGITGNVRIKITYKKITTDL